MGKLLYIIITAFVLAVLVMFPMSGQKDKIYDMVCRTDFMPKGKNSPSSLNEQPKAVPEQSKDSESVKKINAAQDDVLSYRLKSKNRVEQIQICLKKADFYSGNIDGKQGPQTKKAIKDFQKAKGLVVDGIVGQKTWGELLEYLND
ncbi:MAG: peptidoglycan-binding domain-containing protein [Candidatus Omnitrophota bacterium]